MAAVHWRHLWTGFARAAPSTFWWGAIRHDSYVVITAAEARTSSVVPDRFIGEAVDMRVTNIAPQDGVVSFQVWWDGAFPYLNIWTDITVFDPGDPHGTN
jgi:hypothetical protein